MNNKKYLIFLVLFVIIISSFVIVGAQDQENYVKTRVIPQSVDISSEETTKTTTYTYTSVDSALRIREKDYWHVVPASENHKAHIIVNEKEEIIEADLTASKETSWTFGDKTLKVQEGTRVIFKDGKLEISGKMDQELSFKESDGSEVKLLFLDEKGIELYGKYIKGNFRLSLKENFIDITGFESNSGLVKCDFNEYAKLFELQKGSVAYFNGVKLSVLDQKDKGFVLNGLFLPDGRAFVNAENLNIQLEFNEGNLWIEVKDSKGPLFNLRDAKMIFSRDSSVGCSLISNKGEITERNGNHLITYTSLGVKDTLIAGDNSALIPLTRSLNTLTIKNDDLSGRLLAKGKHDDLNYEETSVSQKEFLDYLKRIETRFPEASKEEILIALFHDVYGDSWSYDKDRQAKEIPHKNDAIGWSNMFSFGTDAKERVNAFEEVYSRFLEDNGQEVNAGLLRENGFSTPEMVTLPDGSSVKIAHVIAGLAGHVSGRENAKERGASEKEGIKEGAILAYSITEGGNLFEVWDKTNVADRGFIKRVWFFLKEYNTDDESKGEYPASQKTAALWSARSKHMVGDYEKLSDLIKAIYERNRYPLE